MSSAETGASDLYAADRVAESFELAARTSAAVTMFAGLAAVALAKATKRSTQEMARQFLERTEPGTEVHV